MSPCWAGMHTNTHDSSFLLIAHPEQNIQSLMNLGASRSEVIAALDAAGGNVDFAASFLF